MDKLDRPGGTNISKCAVAFPKAFIFKMYNKYALPNLYHHDFFKNTSTCQTILFIVEKQKLDVTDFYTKILPFSYE